MNCELKIFFKGHDPNEYCHIKNVVKIEQCYNDIIATCKHGDKYYISTPYTESIVIINKQRI